MGFYNDVRKQGFASEEMAMRFPTEEGAGQELDTPEHIFEEGVSELVSKYLESTFPYLRSYNSELKVMDTDLDNNSLVLALELYSSQGEPVASIPVMYSGGKIVEPWTIYSIGEQRMFSLIEDMVDKIMQSKEIGQGIIPPEESEAIAQMNYSYEKSPEETLTNKYSTLNLVKKLQTKELVSALRTVRKDADLYLRFGRILTKEACNRLLFPEKKVTPKETYTLKRGCMVVSTPEELAKIKLINPRKKASFLESMYSGEGETFVTGVPEDALFEIKEANTKITNLYAETFGHDVPVVAALDKDTGKEIYLLKLGRNIVPGDELVKHGINYEEQEDSLVRGWNQPENLLNVVQREGWYPRFIKHITSKRFTEPKFEKELKRLSTTLSYLKNFEDKKGETREEAGFEDLRMVTILLIPKELGTRPESVRKVLELHIELNTKDDTLNFSTAYSSEDLLYLAPRVAKAEDGIVELKDGQEFIAVATGDGRPYSTSATDILTDRVHVVCTDDSIQEAGEMQKFFNFADRALSVDDATKTRLAIRKVSDTRFDVAVAYTMGRKSVMKPLPNLPRKTAGFLLGMGGSSDPATLLAETGPAWRVFTSDVSQTRTNWFKKIANNTELLDEILASLRSQADGIADGGGKVSINIENLNLSTGDKGGIEGVSRAKTEKVTEEPMETPQPAPVEEPPIDPHGADIGMDSGMDPGMPPPGMDPGMPPPEQMIDMLLQLGITEQNIGLMDEVAQFLGIDPAEVYMEMGFIAETQLEQGVPIDQVNMLIEQDLMGLLQGGTPEMAATAGMPDDMMMGPEPMHPEQEMMVDDAGHHVEQAMPAPYMETPMHDTASAVAASPVAQHYPEETKDIQSKGVLADMIGSAVIKSNFVDYLPVLSDTMNTIAELILKIELTRSNLISDVGSKNVDQVLEDLREMNKLVGNLILKVTSFG